VKNYAKIRGARAKALAEGTAAPVAFWFEDPELTTSDNGSVFEIHFNDVIDDWYGISSAMVTEALLSAGGKDVLVHVNSPGGMVFEGLSIHSAFKQYSGEVTMRVEGLAASAASYVIQAGDKIVIEPGAMVMIHDALDITIGNAKDHRKTADVLDKVSDSIAAIYADRAGGDAETWRAAMKEETWYGGAEAVDAGLVDSVVAAADASATAKNTARWRGMYAGMPGTDSGNSSDWGGENPMPNPLDPPIPDPAPEPEPLPTPEDPAPEPESSPERELEDLLAGYDLSAVLKNAFSKGVPA
jgi:ATP-dependent protease ClpP protease subunit